MTFLWSRLAQSLLKRTVVVVVAALTGPKLAPTLASIGVTLDPTALTAALYAALETARAWVTHQPKTHSVVKTLL
jgi:hypothetical protein